MTKFYLSFLTVVFLIFGIPGTEVAGLGGGYPDKGGYKCVGTVETLTGPAERGNAHSQLCLGDLYKINTNGEKNFKLAMIWYGKAAEQGNSHAQFQLGRMLYVGVGGKQNKAGAIRWFRKASEKDNYAAKRILGLLLLGQGESQNFDEAVKLLINWKEMYPFQIFKKDLFELPQWLVNSYAQEGKYLLKDVEQSLFKLANQGNIESQFLYGIIPVKEPAEEAGELKQFIKQKKIWLCRSAEGGLALGQLWCGYCYDREAAFAIGKGQLGKDYFEYQIEALKWLKLGLKNSSKESMAKISRDAIQDLENRMSPEQIAQAQKRAWEWKPKPNKLP